MRNIAASIHQRLLDAARRTGRPFGDVLQFYALERWLYRLSQSDHRERFILKGALMLVVWDVPVSRPTRDIDLLGCLGNDLDGVRRVIGEICDLPAPDDGLAFDPVSVTTERIAADADYEGVRARFKGRLGATRIAMQVDIGFSDVITPGPVEIDYPTLLDQPAPRLRAYNRETVVAEKFEAMVKLGELNSRMKDFFDIWLLAQRFAFDSRALGDAVDASFHRRGTALELDTVCLTSGFADAPTKQAQWDAFLRRSNLSGECGRLREVVDLLHAFLGPVATALIEERVFEAQWPAGGPWRSGDS